MGDEDIIITQREKERAYRTSVEKYALDLQSRVVYAIRQTKAVGDIVSEKWKMEMAARFLKDCGYTIAESASITELPVETVLEIARRLGLITDEKSRHEYDRRMKAWWDGINV
jgi:hypothetical protein